MITLISLIDAVTVLATACAIVVFLTGSRRALPGELRTAALFMLILFLIHNTGNLLEWAGITHLLEEYEDFVVALIPILFIFVIYMYLHELSEEQLRLSKERYEMLFNSSNDAVFVHGYTEDGAPGPFLAVNEVACQLLGYSRQELLERTPRDIITAESRRAVDVTARKLRQLRHLIFERIFVSKDGKRIPVELSSRAFELGGSTIALSVARDLRARKEMEEQIRRSQRLEAIGRLAGGIAHDFNNLLTVIGGYSEVLLGEIEPESPLREEVREIHAAAERAAWLTRQLLAFGRKQILQPRIVDLVRLVHKSDQMLRRLIGEDILLAIETRGDIWKIKIDPGQMEQVLLNLAINSRDAMPDGGKITVRLANVRWGQAEMAGRPGMVAGEYVRIVFSDTGSGMDPGTLAHIFEPFYTTKELGRGTGLGLSTVYGIIKQSGGFIYASSEPGKGSSFEILLPRFEETASAPEPSIGEQPPAAAGMPGATVLVVEDEAKVREFIRDTLNKHGYSILTAQDGTEAMEIWGRAEKIDLVLTDLVLPGMSGVELCTRLRRQKKDLRCLLISGYAGDRLERHNISETGIPLLAKPFTSQELVDRINGVIG